MRKSTLREVWFAVALFLLFIPAGAAEAASSHRPGKIELGVCPGKFAICAAATCRRTDQKVDGKQAAECECPVLNGLALANMAAIQQSCKPQQANTIYSLYSTCEPADVDATLMQCPKGSYAQCWNARCSYEEGARVAKCICPIQHGEFITPGGQCILSNCRDQLLVGAPFRGSPTCKRN